MTQQLSDIPAELRPVLAKLLQSFAAFNFNAIFEHVSTGPLVTSFYFGLKGSTQIANIYARREDIALALGVDKVTITRVGGLIVIYVPNEQRGTIDFKDYLHWFMHSEEVAAQ